MLESVHNPCEVHDLYFWFLIEKIIFRDFSLIGFGRFKKCSIVEVFYTAKPLLFRIPLSFLCWLQVSLLYGKSFISVDFVYLRNVVRFCLYICSKKQIPFFPSFDFNTPGNFLPLKLPLYYFGGILSKVV